MKRATLSAVHALLEGTRPKKGLSQHFLVDSNITRKVATTAKVSPGDHVIEIGPGLGGLTEALIEAGARVTAVEKDPRFLPILEKLPIKTLIQDARTIDWASLLTPETKIVANLPFHITSEILECLLPHATTLTLIVQRELAERFTSNTCDRALTALLHTTCHIHEAFTISPSCFYPRPHITSSVIHIQRHRPISPEAITTLKRLYQNRRKMLRHTFPESICLAHNIDPTKRPEHLTPNELYHLTQTN